MPRKKLTPDTWGALLRDYEAWDPEAPDAETIEEVVAEHGISKQTFYYEMRKRGLPLKGKNGTRSAYVAAASDADNRLAVPALTQALVEATLENARLRRILDEHKIPH